jgi:hypothetical protein
MLFVDNVCYPIVDSKGMKYVPIISKHIKACQNDDMSSFQFVTDLLNLYISNSGMLFKTLTLKDKLVKNNNENMQMSISFPKSIFSIISENETQLPQHCVIELNIRLLKKMFINEMTNTTKLNTQKRDENTKNLDDNTNTKDKNVKKSSFKTLFNRKDKNNRTSQSSTNNANSPKSENVSSISKKRFGIKKKRQSKLKNLE